MPGLFRGFSLTVSAKYKVLKFPIIIKTEISRFLGNY